MSRATSLNEVCAATLALFGVSRAAAVKSNVPSLESSLGGLVRAVTNDQRTNAERMLRILWIWEVAPMLGVGYDDARLVCFAAVAELLRDVGAR